MLKHLKKPIHMAIAVTNVYTLLYHLQSFTEGLSLKPPNNPVEKKVWIVRGHRGWVICSGSRSGWELGAQECLVLPNGVCTCSTMKAKPTSRTSDEIPTSPGLMWLEQRKCSFAPTHRSWPMGIDSRGKEVISWSPVCAGMWVSDHCKWEHTHPIVVPHAAEQPASPSDFQGGVGSSPESHAT